MLISRNELDSLVFIVGISLMLTASLIGIFGGALHYSIEGIVTKCQPTYFTCFATNHICRFSYYTDITNETCIEFDTPCYMNTGSPCKIYDEYDDYNIRVTTIIIMFIGIAMLIVSCMCSISSTQYQYNGVPTINSNI